MNITRQVQEIEKKAHTGAYGAWRKAFCQEYRHLLSQIRAETLSDFRQHLTSTGESITCRKGCVHCCYQYMSISIAHGIAVVDFLYSHEAVLRRFLANYQKWRRSIESSPVNLDILKRLEECTTLRPTPRHPSQELLTSYFNMSVACPFLVDSACAVYAVQPICCGSHYSISPPEWCRVSSPNPPHIYEAVPSEVSLRRLAGLADPRLAAHQETLPTLVYRLLTEGLPAVLQGLDELAARAQGED